jgi:hypothetical protein
MKDIDQIYQKTVDLEVERLLGFKADQLLAMGDYGSITTTIENKRATIAWWHYSFSGDEHHFIFQMERPFLLFFTKKYLGGLKLYEGCIQKLTQEEVSAYD